METQAALVGTDGAVHLNAEALIDLDFALVINPGDAKENHAFRLDAAFQNLGFAVFGTFVQNWPDGLDDFFHRLMKLHFRGVLSDHVFHKGSNVLSHFDSPFGD